METKAELRKQAIISTLKFMAFTIALDAAMAGLLQLVFPLISFATYMIIGLIFIIASALIIEISRRF